MGRAPILLAAAVALISSSLLASPPGQARDGKSEGVSLMNELSESFSQLDARVAAGDLEGAAEIAGAMHEFAERLGELDPEVNPALADVFDQHVARLAEVAGEIAETAAAGRIEGTGQAFEELRATCVACHLTFRDENGARGNFPARDNTIAGVVELADADGKLRDDRSWVLVFLEGEGVPWKHARKNPRISQKGRRFYPRVLPVIAGTEVEFPNDDTIFHNVFSLSKTAPFDLGVYEPGEKASVRMERTGLVKVYCNIHPEMAASIVVLDNPWYALTDRAGNFVLCSVPDGEYVLRAWNDMGAEAREPIQVSGGRVLEKRIRLSETRRSVQHSNKFGKPYSGKYR
jgi:plastocyanin